MRRPRRLLAAAGAALVLAGCGSVHPGAAAVVGDTRISFDRLDTLSAAYCQATIAIADSQGKPVNPLEGVSSRRAVLGALLQLQLARQAAAALGIKVAPGTYTSDQRTTQPLLDAVGPAYAGAIREIIAVNDETSGLLTAIGAHQLGQDPAAADPNKAISAGQRYIREFGTSIDIDIDPRLGLSPGGQVIADSGSLSVPVSSEAVTGKDPTAVSARVASLPPSQVCS